MRFNFLKNLGLLLLPLATFASNAEVAMVIIEDADKDNYSSAIKTCTDYKIEYDPITIPKDGYKDNIENLFYNNVDGKLQPKYTVLVFPNGRVSYKDGKTWTSAITDAQWDQIEGYARNNDVRLVFLNEYPSTATGTKLYKACDGSDCKFDLTHKVIADEQNLPLGDTVNSVNLVVNENIYHVPAAIDPTQGMEVIPVMYFSPAEPDYPEQTVAAVTVNKNGAKLIAFYMAFGEWSKESSALNVVWLSWATGKDLKHLNGGSYDSNGALQDAASGDVKSNSLEIVFVTLATLFTILATLF